MNETKPLILTNKTKPLILMNVMKPLTLMNKTKPLILTKIVATSSELASNGVFAEKIGSKYGHLMTNLASNCVFC